MKSNLIKKRIILCYWRKTRWYNCNYGYN